MSSRTAEERIRGLARDLAPVRRIPPLRTVLAAALALGCVAVAGHWLLGGPGLRPSGAAGAWSSGPYLATLLGLALLALGAIGATLAAAVPGRAETVRLGAGAVVLGLGVALAGGLWGAAAGGSALAGVDLGASLACILRALVLGVAPALLVCVFVVYAALRRPGVGAALALAGCVALGATAVHATCPSDSAWHWIFAHAVAPVFAVLVFTAPLARLLSQAARRG